MSFDLVNEDPNVGIISISGAVYHHIISSHMPNSKAVSEYPFILSYFVSDLLKELEESVSRWLWVAYLLNECNVHHTRWRHILSQASAVKVPRGQNQKRESSG